MMSSIAEENVACVLRTSSLRPRTSTNQPSFVRSARCTSHVLVADLEHGTGGAKWSGWWLAAAGMRCSRCSTGGVAGA